MSAYLYTSSAFLTHHSSCILHSTAWACLWRCLKQSRLGMNKGSFCHLTKAFHFSPKSVLILSSFLSNQSRCTCLLRLIVVCADSFTSELNCSHPCVGQPVRGPWTVCYPSKSAANSLRCCGCSSLVTLNASLMAFGILQCVEVDMQGYDGSD